MTRSSLSADLRRLAGSSAIYGVGSVVLRALGFILLPLYTRYLTRADYGITGAMSSILAVMAICLPLGLHGSIARLWFSAPDEEGRREAAGTVFMLMVTLGLTLTFIVDSVGQVLFDQVFPSIPYQPFGRLVVWTAFLHTIGVVPLAVLQAREKATAYVTITATSAITTIVITVWLVVVEKQGAVGYLRGQLIGAGALVLPYFWLALRNMKLTFRPPIATAALAYSLPLVPHGLAAWILDLSDRAILARYVTLEQLGLYSVGYQFGAILGLAVTAFSSAWVPFVYRSIQERGHQAHQTISTLATYYVFVLTFLGLGLSLFVHAAVVLATSSPFHGAHTIAPWIVGGYIFNGLYIIPVTFLFWKENTKVIPVVTAAAGIGNVVLNLIFVPLFGIHAAAATSLVAYGIMFMAVWLVAQRIYPFEYEVGRGAACLALGFGLYFWATTLPPMSLMSEMSIRIVVWLSFPALLLALRIVRPAERRRVFAVTHSLWQKGSS